MTDTQKVIKYCAIVFGVMLVAQIFFGIISFVFFFKNTFNFVNKLIDNNEVGEVVEYNNKVEKFNSMDITLNSTSLNITRGDKLSISTNNDELKINVKNSKLIISDSNKNLNKKYILNIVLPYNIEIYDSIYIKSGAVIVSLNDIYAKKFDLEQGAGKVKINNCIVSDKTDIECGAGAISVDKSVFNGLNLELGFGSFKLNMEASDNSKIEVGMGNGRITFIDGLDNYKIDARKGIGSFSIDDNRVNDNSIFGDGPKKVKIEGGVGSIKID